MTAISPRLPAVAVEYDSRGKRVTKKFDDANEAKQFFAAKEKEGKNPKVQGDAPGKRRKAATTTAEHAPTTAPGAAPASTASKPANVPGVAAGAKTRAYWAGVVIRRHGHAAGVTDAMIAEVDAAAGKPNAVESAICLRNAWHVVKAWTE